MTDYDYKDDSDRRETILPPPPRGLRAWWLSIVDCLFKPLKAQSPIYAKQPSTKAWRDVEETARDTSPLPGRGLQPFKAYKAADANASLPLYTAINFSKEIESPDDPDSTLDRIEVRARTYTDASFDVAKAVGLRLAERISGMPGVPGRFRVWTPPELGGDGRYDAEDLARARADAIEFTLTREDVEP